MENATLESLFDLLKLDKSEYGHALYLLGERDSRYLKDLKINIQNALQFEHLNKKESLLLALSVAVNEKNAKLIHTFRELAKEEDASDDEIAEIYGCVSMMNVNNVFYRFRHFTGKDYYTQTPGGIKMSLMARPVLGKEFFELVSLAISAVNGCEMCVNSHEASVIQHGATQARVYDAVRLASIIKGLDILI